MQVAALFLSLLPVAASAQDIYKCAGPAGVSYQSMTCAAGEVETRLSIGSTIARTAATPSASPPAPRRQRDVAIGMSDVEVLNMPAWGRPAHIARMRTARGWQEDWTYASPAAGERRLRFMNARLADIVDGSAPQVAQLTLQ